MEIVKTSAIQTVELEDILNQLLTTKYVRKVEIKVDNKDNPNFTHVLIGVNKKDKPFIKILYNKQTNSIFQTINDFPQKTKETETISITNLEEIDKDMLYRSVTSAVLLTIKDHGDITKTFASSAAKRIVGHLIGILKSKAEK